MAVYVARVQGCCTQKRWETRSHGVPLVKAPFQATKLPDTQFKPWFPEEGRWTAQSELVKKRAAHKQAHYSLAMRQGYLVQPLRKCNNCARKFATCKACPCKTVWYCGVACQTIAWSQHKQQCPFMSSQSSVQ